MIRNYISALVTCSASFMFTAAQGQSVLVEAMAGNKNYFYQHTLLLPLNHSQFSIFHTSSMYWVYQERQKNEAMTQSYITYPLAPFARLALGTFYASQPGISASLAAQFQFGKRHFRALLVPRADLKKNGSVEGMALFEYMPPINERTSFYSRVQFMSNFGPDAHNRSYQNFRLGASGRRTTAGLALNIDERGPEKQTQHNWGVFILCRW